LPARWLEARPVMADPLASQQALAFCERELALLTHERTDIRTRVAAELALDNPANSGRYPTLTAVATRLCMSPRTLKRHLQQHGISYKELRLCACQRDAVALLEYTDLSVNAIA